MNTKESSKNQSSSRPTEPEDGQVMAKINGSSKKLSDTDAEVEETKSKSKRNDTSAFDVNGPADKKSPD